jgi:hypothetical protein
LIYLIFPLNIIEFGYADIEKLCKNLKLILDKNGLFIITIEDGLKNVLIGNDNREEYSIKNGMHSVFHKIPNKGTFEYQFYFWTLPFAKHIISRYFSLVQEIEYKDNRFFLAFRNIK